MGGEFLGVFDSVGVADWTQQFGRRRSGPQLNLLHRRQSADGVEDDSLDSLRRDPWDRSGFFPPTLVQNARDIIAVAHSLLDRVARRHRVASIVEQLAHEQGVGALTRQASPLAIFGQLGLNRFEQSRVDNRRVLAGITLVAMVDLSDVHSVAQHIGQWPIGETSTTDYAAGGKSSNLMRASSTARPSRSSCSTISRWRLMSPLPESTCHCANSKC